MLSAQKYGENLHVNYSPFGATLYGRNWSSEKYRYGFNGMEKDDEVKGSGNSYDFGARMYDSRLGRWPSLDRVSKEWQSNYVFGANNPIIFLDVDGNDDYYFNEVTGKLVIVPTSTAPSYSLSINDDLKIDINIEFNIYMSPILDESHPGHKEFISSNHKNLSTHITLHEEGHVEQKLEIILNSKMAIEYDDKVYTGTADEIMNKIYSDMVSEFAKSKGISEDRFDWSPQDDKEFNSIYWSLEGEDQMTPIDKAFKLITSKLFAAELRIYAGSDENGIPKIEADANERANKKLIEQGLEIPSGEVNFVEPIND